MPHDHFLSAALARLQDELRYRVFADLERIAGRFPHATWRSPDGPRPVVIWCSNDYLGMPNQTHIVPVMVGDPEKCREASDLLLADHGIYIQPINYPTVPRGTERLRITPTPHHDDRLIDALAEGLVDVWGRLNLPLRYRALAAE